MIALTLAMVLAAACETVPVSGRHQLLLFPEGQEVQMGATAYRDVLKKGKVSNDPALNERVTRVGRRIAQWLTEVTGTKIGRWPIAEVPVKMSESPAYIGGRLDRGAPCYGEDNDYVYGELLGMSSEEIKALAAEGVI